MAKKNRDEVPNPHSVANRDIIQRLNFLYQASVYLNSIPNPTQPSGHLASSPRPSVRKTKSGCNTKPMRNCTANDLAKTYISSMKTVGQKTTVKIDPAVKRTICKRCNVTLIPGLTTMVRVKKSTSHGHFMVYTCSYCNTSRRIPAPPVFAMDIPLGSDAPMQVDTKQATESLDLSPSAQVPLANPNEAIETPGMISRRKNRVASGQKPLSARDAGHVVFCGNERLDLEPGRGNGSYIS